MCRRKDVSSQRGWLVGTIALTRWSGLAQLAQKQTPIEKYLYLSTIRKNNVHLFYRLVTDHIQVRYIR